MPKKDTSVSRRHADMTRLDFFVFLGGDHLAASERTISRWIRVFITMIYELEGRQTDTIRSHEIRALSASRAVSGGVPIADVMSAACWQVPTSFAMFYLRDLAPSFGRAALLGSRN